MCCCTVEQALAGLGGETAANANGIFAELLGPDTLEADTDGRKDGNVEYRQQSFGDTFRGGEIERDSAEAEVHHAGALYRLVGEHGIGVRARHGNPLGFARDAIEAGLFGGHHREHRLGHFEA